MKIPRRKRKVTTITLDPKIVEKARKYNLNISRMSEDALRETIRRLESEAKPMGAPGIKKGGIEEMERKKRGLPGIWWTTAAIVVAAIVVGSIALWPSEKPGVTPGPAWSYVFGENIDANYSGIIAIYIAKPETDNTTDPATWTSDNYFQKIEAEGTVDVYGLYGKNFYIVIEARGATPYIANLDDDNIKVELGCTGDVSLTAENKTGTQFSWRLVEGSENIRVSAVWGPYIIPTAGGSFNYTARVWLWY